MEELDRLTIILSIECFLSQGIVGCELAMAQCLFIENLSGLAVVWLESKIGFPGLKGFLPVFRLRHLFCLFFQSG
jgi:hypothetical protein